jgi:hypothetical protein
MSQFEMIDLWVTHMNFLLALFVAFMSATSAFVIVANVKGNELHPAAAMLVRYIYIVASVFFLLFMGKVAESILNLRAQMREAGMDWYNVVYESQIVLPLILITGLLVGISLIAGSLWYFGSVRRG